MSNKRVLVLALAAVMPITFSCNLKSKVFRKKSTNEQVMSAYDSLHLQKDVSVRVNDSNVNASFKKRLDSLTELEYYSEKSITPIKVKGESFETTIAGNWVVDSTQLLNGKLIYFDIDNPTLKATIYTDSTRQMKISIQTKDQIIDVPVDKVSFRSKNRITADSQSVIDTKVFNKDSINRATQIAVSNEKLEIKSSELIVDKQKSGFPLGVCLSFWGVGLLLIVIGVLGMKYGWFWKLISWVKNRLRW